MTISDGVSSSSRPRWANFAEEATNSRGSSTSAPNRLAAGTLGRLRDMRRKSVVRSFVGASRRNGLLFGVAVGLALIALPALAVELAVGGAAAGIVVAVLLCSGLIGGVFGGLAATDLATRTARRNAG